MSQFKHKLTDDPEKKTKARKGQAKITRVAKRKALYAAQPARTMANKKRAIARHLRHFPEDAQGVKYCAAKYSEPFALTQITGPTGKARAREHLRARLKAKTARKVAQVIADDTALGLSTFTIEPPSYAPFT